jgi:putative FmdB family regulatory protein
MPTYQYRCAKCGEQFELWQSIHDDALKRHPGCGGVVTKVMAPAGIVLKGSGFYRTDSRAAARKGGSKDKDKDTDKEPAKDGAGTSGNGSGSGSDAKAKDPTSEKSKDSKSSKPSKDTKATKSGGSKSGTSSS